MHFVKFTLHVAAILFFNLKTLFNIVEAPFFFYTLMFVVYMCMMMSNKQPGIQKFWNLCRHYQDIYNCYWIPPLNKQSGLPFILTEQSMGRNE